MAVALYSYFEQTFIRFIFQPEIIFSPFFRSHIRLVGNRRGTVSLSLSREVAPRSLGGDEKHCY